MSTLFGFVRNQKVPLMLVLLFGVLALAGCTEDSDTPPFANNSSNGGPLTVQQPAAVTNTASSDYDKDVNGLITWKTLKGWIDNWDKNKPSGISGKLVILQMTKGPTNANFIKPAPQSGVFTYVEAGWTMNRNDGVAYVNTMVLDGPSMDSLLYKYGIDVNKDMVVCAQGGSSNFVYMLQGRCWFALSYWGVPQNHISVLDGNNQYLSGKNPAYFTDDTADGTHASPIINRQISSVKDLKDDNFSIFASIEDLINVLPLTDDVDRNDGVFIWDARNLHQYSAGQYEWQQSASGKKTIQPYGKPVSSSFQNKGARQSHPRGALNLEYVNLMDTATGLYLPKAELQKILNGGASPDGPSFVSGVSLKSQQGIGFGNGYQPGDTVYLYCETSMRAGVAIIATAVILGLPSRLFDGAMIEWNSMTAGIKDKNGNVILPSDSPWNTEYLSRPVGVYGTDDSTANGTSKAAPRSVAGWAAAENVSESDIRNNLPATPIILNPYAKHANAVVTTDRAYKTPAKKPASGGSSTGGSGSGSSSGSGSGSSGPSMPGNPCSGA